MLQKGNKYPACLFLTIHYCLRYDRDDTLYSANHWENNIHK